MGQDAATAVTRFMADPSFAGLIDERERTGFVHALDGYLDSRRSRLPHTVITSRRRLGGLRTSVGQRATRRSAERRLEAAEEDLLALDTAPAAHADEPPLSDAALDALANLTIDVIILLSTVLPAGRIPRNATRGAIGKLRVLIGENPNAFRAFADILMDLARMDENASPQERASEIVRIVTEALALLNDKVGLARILGLIFTAMSTRQIVETVGFILLSAVLRLIPWLGIVRYTVNVVAATNRVLEDLDTLARALNHPHEP